MSVQIESIILYNYRGESRKLDFQVGAVNIITGSSNRGKSAIIPIIEFCLGNSEFEVPGDVIKRTVAYYCVVFIIGNERFLVAKPPPSPGSNRQYRGTFILNPSLATLSPSELTPKTNDDEIRRHITALLRQVHGSDQPISMLRSIDRSRYYLFQKSTTILHDHLLFHRQETEANLIKESLPFFLGISQEDEVVLVREFDEAVKRSEKIQRQLSAARRQVAESVHRGRVLIQELIDGGLINSEATNIDSTDISHIANLLGEAIIQWQPGQAPSIMDQRLAALQSQLKIAKENHVRTQMRIQAIRSLQQDAAGYTEQMEDQRMRLQSIELISNQNPFEFADSVATCPLCNSILANPSINSPKISAIRSSLEKLNQDLAAVTKEKPTWNGILEDLDTTLRSEQKEIEKIQIEVARKMKDNQVQDNILQEIVRANSRVERLIGRTEYFLETVEDGQLEKLETEKALAAIMLAELQQRIASRNPEEIRRRVINNLSAQMTSWSSSLDFSYNGRFVLDPEKLTVIVETNDSSIPMSQLGGNPNILGCHLLALLALHKHFIEYRQPVPGFIVLDQPLQGYFPSMKNSEETGQKVSQTKIQDSETKAATRIFDFLFMVNEELAPHLQIIVLEHARLDDDRFRRALVGNETWFDESGLIPKEWLEPAKVGIEQSGLF